MIHHICPKLNYSFVVSNLETIRLKFSQDELGLSSEYADLVSLNNELEYVRVPPTQRFYETHSEQHNYLASYDAIVNRALIIERERKHLHTHVPLYTAFKKEVLLLQVFNAALLTRANKNHRKAIIGRTWYRDPFGNPPGNIRFEKIKDYSKLQNRSTFFGRDVALDNKGATSWHLISCNPHLYGNTLHASEESTLDYFHDNSNVTPPDIRDIFHKTIKNSGLDNLNREETEVFF